MIGRVVVCSLYTLELEAVKFSGLQSQRPHFYVIDRHCLEFCQVTKFKHITEPCESELGGSKMYFEEYVNNNDDNRLIL